jgi:hypothetical protein
MQAAGQVSSPRIMRPGPIGPIGPVVTSATKPVLGLPVPAALIEQPKYFPCSPKSHSPRLYSPSAGAASTCAEGVALELGRSTQRVPGISLEGRGLNRKEHRERKRANSLGTDKLRAHSTVGSRKSVPNGAHLRTIWDDTVLCKSPSMEAWQRLTPPVEPKVAQPSWL